MARTTKKTGRQRTWIALDEAVSTGVPQFNAVLGDDQDFISLHVKLREDGTYLGVLKRYSADGAPMVCFGSGYGFSGCLVALDATIAGNNWKVDKPWDGKKG